MTHQPWNNGEYHYIVELMRTRGNHKVPCATVLSYLELQSKGAMRDGEVEISSLLLKAHVILELDNLSDSAFDEALALLMAPKPLEFREVEKGVHLLII